MITGLLENQQKQREQQKQDSMAAYLGQAPGAHAGGDSKSGLLSGLGGMLQGMGGGAKKPDNSPIPGPGGGKLLSEDEVYGPATGATSSYLSNGPQDNDDEYL